MPRRTREVILEALIEYSNSDVHRLTNEDRKIEDTVKNTLTQDLPRELEQFFGLKVKIDIKGVRYGSLSVFFGVVLTTYGLLSSYKGLYESVELIRQQADDLLEAALRQLGQFSVGVYKRYPKFEEPERIWSRRWKGLGLDPMLAEFLTEAVPPYEPHRSRRDGFFYFLLALCVVALIIEHF